METFWVIIIILVVVLILIKYLEKKSYIKGNLAEMSEELEKKERYFRVLKVNETVYIKADSEEYAHRNVLYAHNFFKNYALEIDLVSKNTKKHLSYSDNNAKTLVDVVQNATKFFEEDE